MESYASGSDTSNKGNHIIRRLLKLPQVYDLIKHTKNQSYCKMSDIPPNISLLLVLAIRDDMVELLQSEELALNAAGNEYSSDDAYLIAQSELEVALSTFADVAVCLFYMSPAGPSIIKEAEEGLNEWHRSDGAWIMYSLPLDRSSCLDLYIPPRSFFTTCEFSGDLEANYPVNCCCIPVLRRNMASDIFESEQLKLDAFKTTAVTLLAEAVGMVGTCMIEDLYTKAKSMIDNASESRYIVSNIPPSSPACSFPKPLDGCPGDSMKKVKRVNGFMKTTHPFWNRNAIIKVCTRNTGSAKYVALQKVRESLPARQARDTFLSLATHEEAFIVTGETGMASSYQFLQLIQLFLIGCGKTTQIPQYLLEWQDSNGVEARILVCQPRRLAAVGVAMRVAEERGCNIGEYVCTFDFEQFLSSIIR